MKLLINQAKGKVGTMSNVIGGVCTTDSFCPVKFACVGCAAKVPDPEKKHQIEFQLHWATNNRKTYIEMELHQEANKMTELIRNCKKELEEIETIDRYRKDESYDPSISLD